MKKLLFLFLLISVSWNLKAQENLDYQKPPKEILELVDAPLAPSVLIDKKGENVVLLYRDPYKSIAELSEEELRLGGLRINPKTNIGSRTRYYNDIKTKKALKDKITEVEGLPENPRLANFNWSPDQKMIAFTHTTLTGVEIWVLNINESKANRLMEGIANANMGNPIEWKKDNSGLLVNVLPDDRKELIDTDEAIPSGPVVSVSDGEKAQNRTYQDLLSNPNDEFNFQQLALSKIVSLDLNGNATDFLPAAMYSNISISPNGEYVMVSKIKTPFSYIVPYYRFPNETNVFDLDGNLISQVNDVPLQEVLPKGFMSVRTGRRSMNWRNDKPASLIYAKALDEGDPENEVEYRDEVYQLEAPFEGDGKPLLKTINRYRYIQWGNHDIAIAHDYWWNTRNMKAYIFNPSDSEQEPEILFDRNYQDQYNDPGSFVTTKNEFNEYVLEMDGNRAFLMGDGYTPEGQFPFVDEINLKTKKTNRLYRSEYTDKLENLYSSVDMKKGTILVRIESQTDYPNYYFRNIRKKNDLKQITSFENPFKSMQNVHKEVISYEREDGLSLDGTLYLPVDYDKSKKEKKPMILWAYPREYKDKSSAGQNTSNPNEFIYPYYGSPIYWVTQGYVVLDGAAFPIVGEGEEEPNDTFRKQLVDNAKAAIDAVDEMGYIDRTRVAVGGHSYGAFMVANLLSHSDLFAAGIARSGAYNRTLTPFGFQSEERSYWDSPETYYNMSPFMHAEKMKTPLLLIHGQADNNSGTYPLQSERYFNALKGLGATARLVMLPKESHGYSAKESILHMLWEQHEWLEKYVKNKEEEKTESESGNSK
ncbi:prolyl oligopeptidase family serine peptidase [Marivirga tractuosa]|uniref:S9 family peptidase n=1 Tax=Marivirga tractuosa TaxID=1006 RepID=UPI0035CECCBD